MVVDGEIVYLTQDLTFSGLDFAIKQYIVERNTFCSTFYCRRWQIRQHVGGGPFVKSKTWISLENGDKSVKKLTT